MNIGFTALMVGEVGQLGYQGYKAVFGKQPPKPQPIEE